MSTARAITGLVALLTLVGVLLATRIGILGAVAALAIALALLAFPASVFVARERRRIADAVPTRHRRPHTCTCCAPDPALTTGGQR